ncbi:MAG: hypothetical protein IKU34_11040 [Clostridia bacterium]|nr:hypothetical protein [Clostridia bacterium]
MRTDLLGLELDHARAILEKEGVVPEVKETAAPRQMQREGKQRVVYAGGEGNRLIVARFVDPIADGQAEG